jgi:hypothetical protein
VRTPHPDTPAILVCQGPQIPPALRGHALRKGVRVRSLIEFQGVPDLRALVAQQIRQWDEDERYRPERYVPQPYSDLAESAAPCRAGVLDDLVGLLARDTGCFALVLGESGAGKTFALRQTARCLIALPDLVPLLIDLHHLDKTHTLHGLVGAHLATAGHTSLDPDALHNLLRTGRLVLLLDGFDELAARVSHERAAQYLNRLTAAAQSNAKIVIASRAQCFQDETHTPTALGEQVEQLPQRRVLCLDSSDAARPCPVDSICATQPPDSSWRPTPDQD